MAKGRLKEIAGQAAEKVGQVRDNAQATLGQAAQKAGEVAGKAKEGAQAFVQNMQEKQQAAKVKKLRPISYELYKSNDFIIPSMIVIVDHTDIKNKDKELLEDAVGWISTEKSMDVLHLIDRDVEYSGLEFTPAARCDTVYYEDPYNKKKFVQVDKYFDHTHESKLAELERIAFSLGAKKSKVEIEEITKEKKIIKKNLGGNIKVNDKTVDGDISNDSYEENQSSTKFEGKIFSNFSGGRPVRPKLLWFSQSQAINNIIDMRCSKPNSVHKREVILRGSTFASMSKTTARKIDIAVKSLGLAKGNSSVTKEWQKETTHKLVFNIEF